MKHHYIPAFYLRQWASDAGKGMLCEHKKVHRTIAPRRTSAEGTGYEVDLYRIRGVPTKDAHHFEEKFMKLVDGDASDALQKLNTSPMAPWSSKLRVGWTQFIISLLFRNPENVSWIKAHIFEMWGLATQSLQEKYAVRRRPTDPPTYAEFMAKTDPAAPHIGASNFLTRIINNDKVGPTVYAMRWHCVDVSNSNVPLLTSDRPLDMPLGLANQNAYIALPIGPHSIFVAAYHDKIVQAVREQPHTKIVKNVNLAIVRQARKFVWGVDDRQLEFVRKHFGLAPDRQIITEEQVEESRKAALGLTWDETPPEVTAPESVKWLKD